MIHISELELKSYSYPLTEPDQQMALASETDSGRIQHGVWQSGPGELNLHFQWIETAFILDGRAEIENLDTGEKFTLVTGSMMTFERGSRWQWRIPWKLKKIFTILD